MPVYASDLKLYGSVEMPDNDDDVNGGAIDTANEITGVLGEVFTDAYSDEAGGDTFYQYRKVFFRNESATSDLGSAKIWIAADPQSHLQIELEATKGGNDTSTDRTTAPGGYTFYDATSEETALTVPGDTLGNSENIGVWLKLEIPAAQSPLNNVLLQLTIKGLSTE